MEAAWRGSWRVRIRWVSGSYSPPGVEVEQVFEVDTLPGYGRPCCELAVIPGWTRTRTAACGTGTTRTPSR